MTKKTIIISGGSLPEEFALSYLKENAYDELIGVDGALAFFYRNEILPTKIVGDFDTIDPKIIGFYENETDIEIRRFNPVKDATDTQIAIELALEIGSTEIILLGGMGSRMDHTLGNLQTMILALNAGVTCRIVDPHNRITVIGKGLTLRREEQYGGFISLIPLTEEVTGVTLKGFKYPLNNYTFRLLDGMGGLGVSNEIIDETAEISFDKGIFLMIEAKD